MKTAVYEEDGIMQLVLTPETDFEKDALERFDRCKIHAEITMGAFYDCQSGWIRQKEIRRDYISGDRWSQHDHSLIIKMDDTMKEDESGN